jgi:pimeloyl-ACP methyl ester carboxylesterase
MPSVSLSTGIVNYTEHGQGIPLVLLHANPGESRDFEAVIPPLSQNYRVIALDWPGYGRSALPQQSKSVDVLLFYKVLREFLLSLALPPAFFIGNSVGGNAAARLAAESPELVRGLVLVAPGGFTPHNFITRTFCQFLACQCIPSAQFVALPCGHASFAEIPELFLAEVQPFLSSYSNV